MLLVMIDNYDSFTFNLVQLFYEFDVDVHVFRSDRTTPDAIAEMKPDWICISPGPKDPAHAGISRAVVERFGFETPVLGVCLGMQVINEAFGGATLKAPLPVHGKSRLVRHGGRGLFEGVPDPFKAARYHSLCIDIRSPWLRATAHTEDGVIMGVEHRSWPVHGVQFHPESFLTECGMTIVGNFLALKDARFRRQAENKNPLNVFPRVGRKSDPESVSFARIEAAERGGDGI
jgi:anthranilate synthase component 2